jgi:hypothetical protein
MPATVREPGLGRQMRRIRRSLTSPDCGGGDTTLSETRVKHGYGGAQPPRIMRRLVARPSDPARVLNGSCSRSADTRIDAVNARSMRSVSVASASVPASIRRGCAASAARHAPRTRSRGRAAPPLPLSVPFAPVSGKFGRGRDARASANRIMYQDHRGPSPAPSRTHPAPWPAPTRASSHPRRGP